MYRYCRCHQKFDLLSCVFMSCLLCKLCFLVLKWTITCRSFSQHHSPTFVDDVFEEDTSLLGEINGRIVPHGSMEWFFNHQSLMDDMEWHVWTVPRSVPGWWFFGNTGCVSIFVTLCTWKFCQPMESKPDMILPQVGAVGNANVKDGLTAMQLAFNAGEHHHGGQFGWTHRK